MSESDTTLDALLEKSASADVRTLLGAKEFRRESLAKLPKRGGQLMDVERRLDALLFARRENRKRNRPLAARNAHHDRRAVELHGLGDDHAIRGIRPRGDDGDQQDHQSSISSL